MLPRMPNMDTERTWKCSPSLVLARGLKALWLRPYGSDQEKYSRVHAATGSAATGTSTGSPLNLGDLYAESGQTLQSSFSAVSKPNFASKFSLETSRRDLHNALLCTVLQTQNFSQKSSTFFRDWILNFWFFHFSRQNLHFVLRFLMKFCPDFATNSRKEWRVSLFQSNLRKQIRKLPKFMEFVKFKSIQN